MIMTTLGRFIMAAAVVVALYEIHQIKLEVEHLAENAKHYYGGPVGTRKEARRLMKKRLKGFRNK